MLGMNMYNCKLDAEFEAFEAYYSFIIATKSRFRDTILYKGALQHLYNLGLSLEIEEA